MQSSFEKRVFYFFHLQKHCLFTYVHMHVVACRKVGRDAIAEKNRQNLLPSGLPDGAHNFIPKNLNFER
jgi:hypothetical protein